MAEVLLGGLIFVDFKRDVIINDGQYCSRPEMFDQLAHFVDVRQLNDTMRVLTLLIRIISALHPYVVMRQLIRELIFDEPLDDPIANQRLDNTRHFHP